MIFEESGPIKELNVDDGMKKLKERLNKWYKKDDLPAAYSAWTQFKTCKKLYDVKMDDYIAEFMRRNNKLAKYEVKIPKSILSLMLLNNAGLQLRDKQIALTGVSFDDKEGMLDNMEKSLIKFFGSQEMFLSDADSRNFSHNGHLSLAENVEAVKIKSEPVFNVEEVNVNQKEKSAYRGNYRGRNGSYRGLQSWGRGASSGRGFSREGNKNSYGKRCYSCGSETLNII